jgi:hypothetical protein
MSDSTTEGYVVSTAEIEGMVRNLCAYALSELDPLQRYVDLTHQQVLFQGMVDAIRKARGRALADVLVSGASPADVVSKTNLTTPLQVTKLVKMAGEADRVKAAAKPPPVKEIKPANGKGRLAAMLPPVAGPHERRILTAAERTALGLPPEGPIPRKKAAPRKKSAARPAAAD